MPNYLVSAGFQADSITAGTVAAAAVEKLKLGIRVDRASKVLPQTATEALFTVAGGPVMITLIYGVVEVVIQTQANNTKLQANPTVAGASVDLCANLDITAKVVGSFCSITGTYANAMVNGLSVPAQATPVLLPAGTVDLVCAASNTGEISWHAWFIPLATGATLVAA
jgi:hypothetical protein